MFSYAAAMEVLRTLQSRYPFVHCAPIATTEYGREITSVRLGCGRRRVLLTAAHHANEWITALILLIFLEDYASAFAAGQRIFGHPARQLYRECTVHLVPLVNINTADADELQRLSGIGEVKAQRIIEHREQYGPFVTIEQIMNVAGIGEATFANIREQICVE